MACLCCFVFVVGCRCGLVVVNRVWAGGREGVCGRC